MVEFKNVKVYGLEESMIRSGYPMRFDEPLILDGGYTGKDEDRLVKLGKVKTGTGHDNALKGIIVQFDLKYPLYFTKQLQRYHWIDIISSQSTMHTITKRGDITTFCNEWVDMGIISIINDYIKLYNEEEDEVLKKRIFMKLVSNLPSGFEMWMGISTNYLQLKTIYFQRKNHKLPDWKVFCGWIEKLPMMDKILGIST